MIQRAMAFSLRRVNTYLGVPGRIEGHAEERQKKEGPGKGRVFVSIWWE